MPQFIGIIIVLVILYNVIVHLVIPFIVYVVLPVLGGIAAILAAIAGTCAAVGVFYGVGVSCYNFVCACRDNLFKRTAIFHRGGTTGTQEPARESYFYWKGDWWLNLIDTCKETWEDNAQKAKSLEEKRDESWRKEGGTFQAIFYLAAKIAVWSGTFLFLPNIFMIFGSIFSLVFVIYNLLAYSLYGIESVYLKIHGVFTLCPNPTCPNPKITFPVFACISSPTCKLMHRYLMPSPQYGIFYRTCQCGEKLPTSGFTGRKKLKAYCPDRACRIELGVGIGTYRPMTIAFLGGPSVGKTMVHLAMCCNAERVFQNRGWEYSTDFKNAKIIADMRDRMRQGIKVYATQVANYVSAFCIDLQKPGDTFPLRLYFYDPPGEIFTDADKNADKTYNQYLRAVIIVIDPFTFPQVKKTFAEELKDKAKEEEIKPGTVSPETSLAHWLVSMERDHGGLAKKTLCAVLINKADVLATKSRFGPGASDEACRQFLTNCGPENENFIRQIEENFRECRFFSVSTTGGAPQGQPFQPKGIEQVMDWLFTHNCFE
jgi:hypothetical protein